MFRAGRRRIWSRLFVGLAAAHVAGLQWCLLQIVAWTGMVAFYVPESGLRAGLSDTFSGEKPCALCLTVEEGRKDERRDVPEPVRQAQREVYPPAETNRDPLPPPPAGLHLAHIEETRQIPAAFRAAPQPPPPRSAADIA